MIPDHLQVVLITGTGLNLICGCKYCAILHAFFTWSHTLRSDETLLDIEQVLPATIAHVAVLTDHHHCIQQNMDETEIYTIHCQYKRSFTQYKKGRAV